MELVAKKGGYTPGGLYTRGVYMREIFSKGQWWYFGIDIPLREQCRYSAAPPFLAKNRNTEFVHKFWNL